MWCTRSALAAAALAAAALPAPSGALALGLGSFGAASAAALERGRDEARKMLRPLSDGLVKPLRVQQKLLVCNAYPSEFPITADKNGEDMLAPMDAVASKNSIAFQECRYVESTLQKQDRLDFDVKGIDVHGTFQVGDLPNTDAVLLLVLERREDSPMLSFQSFAFPSASGRRDAQVAVINTFKGNATAPRLKMEDFIAPAVPGKEKRTVARRTEQLNFNRVYSVEEGEYTASILDDGHDSANVSPTQVLRLNRGENKVVLRMQSGPQSSGESLVIFPNPPLHSAAVRAAPFTLILAALASLVFSVAA